MSLPSDALCESTRRELRVSVAAAGREYDMKRRAWMPRATLEKAYVALATPVVTEAKKCEVESEAEVAAAAKNNVNDNMRTMYDFDGQSTTGSWHSINDGVMGGVSRGGFRVQSDAAQLMFSGELSLKW